MFIKLLALFLLIPIIELFIMFKIGKVIGLEITILIIIITAIIGAKLTKVQGAKAIKNAQSEIKSGKLPHKEVMDGIMIIIAGAFSLLLPALRSNYQKLLLAFIKTKILFAHSPINKQKKEGKSNDDPTIIEAEIINDD